MSVRTWGDPDHSWTDGTETFSAPSGWVSRRPGGDDGDDHMLIAPQAGQDARDIALILLGLSETPFYSLARLVEPEPLTRTWERERDAIGATPIPLTMRDVLAYHDALPHRASESGSSPRLKWEGTRRDILRHVDDGWSDEVAARLTAYFQRPIAPGDRFSISCAAAEEAVPRILAECRIGSLDRAAAALRTVGELVGPSPLVAEARCAMERVGAYAFGPSREIRMSFREPRRREAQPRIAVEWSGKIHVAAHHSHETLGVIEFVSVSYDASETVVRVPAGARAWTIDHDSRVREDGVAGSSSLTTWTTWADVTVPEAVARAMSPRRAARLDAAASS